MIQDKAGRKAEVYEYRISRRAEDCGKLLLRELDMTQYGCKSRCKRRYQYSLPPAICDETTQPGILPVVFTVHCFGCTLETFGFWSQDFAHPYNFLWVNPEGLEKSFHAEGCCGYALEQNVDDVGFFRAILYDLQNLYPAYISLDLVYGTGWSNGGYMVSYAAQPSVGIFHAIAPISGYQLAPDALQAASTSVPLFLHHSLDDPYVRPTGCCPDSTMPKCCCSISNLYDQCTSVEAHVQEWAVQVNGCPIDSQPQVSLQVDDDVTCYTYSQQDTSNLEGSSCQSNTTYCLYQNRGHFNGPHSSLSQNFPLFDAIATFFAIEACTASGLGTWETSLRTCLCSGSEARKDKLGVYCFPEGALPGPFEVPKLDTEDTSLAEEGQEQRRVPDTKTLILVLCFLLTTAWFGRYCWRRYQIAGKKGRSPRPSASDFSPVSTVELSNY